MDYTTTSLIASVRRRASVPNSQQLFNDDDLVAVLSDEMHSLIVPKIMSVNEEYFVTYSDQQTVSGQNNYSIPSRAYAGKLRELAFVGSDGLSFEDIHRVNIDEVLTYPAPYVFYPRGNEVILSPTPTSVQTMRMWFFDRPFTLTTVEESGMITSINTGTNEITLDNVPADWAIGTNLSIVSGSPGFSTKYYDTEIVAISSPTIELDSVDDLEVGDYVSAQGYSCIAQIPADAHHLLAQAGAVKVLEALNDREGMRTAQEKYNQIESLLINTITPRVDGAPRKINSSGNGIFHTKRWGF